MNGEDQAILAGETHRFFKAMESLIPEEAQSRMCEHLTAFAADYIDTALDHLSTCVGEQLRMEEVETPIGEDGAEASIRLNIRDALAEWISSEPNATPTRCLMARTHPRAIKETAWADAITVPMKATSRETLDEAQPVRVEAFVKRIEWDDDTVTIEFKVYEGTS